MISSTVIEYYKLGCSVKTRLSAMQRETDKYYDHKKRFLRPRHIKCNACALLLVEMVV